MVARAVQRLVIESWLPAPIANGPYGHWTTHRKKLEEARVMVWASARQAGWEPVQGKARLEITLVFPQRRRRDLDNLYARVKGCVDGTKEWLVDDDTEHLELLVKAEVQPGRKALEMVLSEEG